jgi:membrane protein implicated in regulation of membrane protease activity
MEEGRRRPVRGFIKAARMYDGGAGSSRTLASGRARLDRAFPDRDAVGGMSPEIVTWIWLGAGVALLASELVVPGLLVGFLGASAILVAGLRWIGLLESFSTSFVAWLAISAVSILGLRSLLQRWSGAEHEVHSTDEDLEAFGQIAEVVAELGSETTGRIRFRGSTWPARCLQGTLPPGSEVRIVDREGLEWIVEPVSPLALEAQSRRERS